MRHSATTTPDGQHPHHRRRDELMEVTTNGGHKPLQNGDYHERSYRTAAEGKLKEREHRGHEKEKENHKSKDEFNVMSPESTHSYGSGSNANASATSHKPKLQLPLSVDPPGPQNPPKQLVWIIFGATGHMGRSLTKACLHSPSHDLVTAVGRTYENTLPSMQNWHAPDPSHCHGTLCDVRSRSSVAAVIASTLERFGRIDVIANCSGYGVIGACEDQDEHEIRNQFETNFMGTLNIIQESLVYFRERGEGRYLIFSSTSGALGVPGLGPYCASKYAVEGLIEAMLYEIDSFNIKATLVEPGLVRRDEPDWASSPLPTWGHFLIKPASESYSDPSSPALHAKRMVQWLGDKQPTSAVKCAELVWQLGHCSYPPLRLLLGSYAIESIRDRLRSITEEAEDWKHLHFPIVEGEGAGDGEEGDGMEEEAENNEESKGDERSPS